VDDSVGNLSRLVVLPQKKSPDTLSRDGAPMLLIQWSAPSTKPIRRPFSPGSAAETRVVGSEARG